LTQIRTLFWDIGGVLLNNAWDRTERKQALTKFNIDEADFQSRHEPLVPSFERGELTLDQYLDQTIFYRLRDFSRDAFRDFMFSLSRPNLESLTVARSLAQSGKYFMATINNESAELNAYRIQTFDLNEIFSLFVSSCFVGMQKPDEKIYRLALQLTQMPAEACCFIDDRPANLEAPARLGMHVIHMESAAQLQKALKTLGVDI